MTAKACLASQKEPFEYTLSIINGKWKLKIIYILACLGVVRYGGLKKSVLGVTHKMLSSQLKELETAKIVLRKEYPQVPPKVEYSLTEKGKTLIPILSSMGEWGKIHGMDG